MSQHNDKEKDITDPSIENVAEEIVENDAAAAPTEETPVEDEVSKLTEALHEQKDKYMRLMAEFDNYRRRTAKESMEIRQSAGKDIVIGLLDVLDDCDRAEQQMAKDNVDPKENEGTMLIFNKLRKVLVAKGLKEMESIHLDFDPDKQEAITQIPAPTPELSGKVLDQVKKGYYLNDVLIRHAQVVIGQ